MEFEIYKEYDGWRWEAYDDQGNPQRVADTLLAVDNNQSDSELIELAVEQAIDEGVNVTDAEWKVME